MACVVVQWRQRCHEDQSMIMTPFCAGGPPAGAGASAARERIFGKLTVVGETEACGKCSFSPAARSLRKPYEPSALISTWK